MKEHRPEKMGQNGQSTHSHLDDLPIKPSALISQARSPPPGGGDGDAGDDTSRSHEIENRFWVGGRRARARASMRMSDNDETRRPSIPNFQFPPTVVENGGGPHIGSTLDSIETSVGLKKSNRNTENKIILDQTIYFGSQITFCRNIFGCFSKKSVSFVGRKKS